MLIFGVSMSFKFRHHQQGPKHLQQIQLSLHIISLIPYLLDIIFNPPNILNSSFCFLRGSESTNGVALAGFPFCVCASGVALSPEGGNLFGRMEG